MLSAFTIKMLDIVNKLFGSSSKRHLNSFAKIIHKINEFEPEFQNLSDIDLRAKTNYFKKLIAEGATIDDILQKLLLL